MTQSEFTNLTQVEVSYNEFEAINEVYMNSEVDKFTFCKMWCKMNQKRVAKSIANKKEAEKDMDNRFHLANIYWTLFHGLTEDEKFSLMADEVLSKSDRKFAEGMGIKVEGVLTSNMMYDMSIKAGINK